MLVSVFLSVFHVLSNSPLSALLPPSSDRAFLVSSRIPQFPSSSICLYNSVCLCILDAVCTRHVSFPSFVLLLFYTSLSPPVFALYSFLFQCVFLLHLFLSHPISCPCTVHPHPFAVCTHFHSVSTLALLPVIVSPFPLIFPFLSFSSPSPALLSLTFFSMWRWESHNASECHLHTNILFTTKKYCNAQKEKICGNIWHRHTTEGKSVPPVHTDVTPEYSWG